MTQHTFRPAPPRAVARPLAWAPAAAVAGDALDPHVGIHPGNPAVAEITGEIDISSAAWLRETLLLAIRWHGPVICLDLGGVSFLDCSGVSALVAAARSAWLEGGQIRVIRMSAPARRVITLLGLQDVLTTVPVGWPH